MIDYEERIQIYGEKLEQCIARTAGESVDVSTWFYFFTFDVMGDFAFAKSFRMLENERWHYAVSMLRRALNLLGPLSSVPWLFQLALSMPFIPVVQDWNRMIAFCSDRIAERIEVGQTIFALKSYTERTRYRLKQINQTSDSSWLPR